MLGLNVCVCLIEFCLWVDGLTKREQLVRAGKLILACLCITDNNTLIRIAHVNAGTIGEHHDIALDNVHRFVVNLHGCRLDNAHILMGVSLHIGFNLLALAVGGFIGSVHNALHCCLGIDIVEYCVLLVFTQLWVIDKRPRVFVYFCNAHFSVSTEGILTHLVSLLHTQSNGIYLGLSVGIAFLHLIPKQTCLVVCGCGG